MIDPTEPRGGVDAPLTNVVPDPSTKGASVGSVGGDVINDVVVPSDPPDTIGIFSSRPIAETLAVRLMAPDSDDDLTTSEARPPKPRSKKKILADAKALMKSTPHLHQFLDSQHFFVFYAEEVPLLLEILLATFSKRKSCEHLCQAIREALRLKIPFHWVEDKAHLTSFTRREGDEVTRWEELPALIYGIGLKPEKKEQVAAKTISHELGHALPQEFMASLFPKIPWGPLPTPEDSYEEAVYKVLLRMAMQEAYAWGLETLVPEGPDLGSGRYLGDNHVILYTFHAAITEADRLKKGQAPNHADSIHGGDLSVEVITKVKEAFGSLRPMVERIFSNPDDPLHGYVRRLISLLREFDLKSSEASPIMQTVSPLPAREDVSQMIGGNHLVTILETHLRQSRYFANVLALTGIESPLTTLSFTIPPQEQGRLWGALADKLFTPENRDTFPLAGLEAVEGLYIQGFVDAGATELAAVLNPDFRKNRDSATDSFAEYEARFGETQNLIGKSLIALARFGPREGLQSVLSLLQPEVEKGFFPLWAKLMVEHLGCPAKKRGEALQSKTPHELYDYLRKWGGRKDIGRGPRAIEKNIVDTYFEKRPGAGFFLNLAHARKILIERGLIDEAKTVLDLIKSVAENFPASRAEAIPPANVLQEMVSLSPEEGGGWKSVIHIMTSGIQTAGEEDIARLLEIVESLVDTSDLSPLSNAERISLASCWEEGIQKLELFLYENLREWPTVLFGHETHPNHVPRIDLDREIGGVWGVQKNSEETAGSHLILRHRTKLALFLGSVTGQEADTMRKTAASILEEEKGNLVWDARHVEHHTAWGIDAFELATDTSLPWIGFCVGETEKNATPENLERAINAVEEALSLRREPFYSLAYAEPLFVLRTVVTPGSAPSLQIDALLEGLRTKTGGVTDKEIKKSIFLHGGRSSRRIFVRNKLVRHYQGSLERAHFRSLIREGCRKREITESTLRETKALLNQASIYDALSATDWQEAAVSFDRFSRGMDPEFVEALYQRTIDVLEMREGELEKFLPLMDHIDRSLLLSTGQKDRLFLALVELLLFQSRFVLQTGDLFESSGRTIGREWRRGRKKTEMRGHQHDMGRMTENFHQVWERANRGQYVKAQMRLLSGLQELQDELTQKDPLASLVFVDPFLREVLYRCGESAVSSPFVTGAIGSPRALGTSFFESDDFEPFTIQSTFAGETNRGKGILLTIDPATEPDPQKILSYRSVSYQGKQYNLDEAPPQFGWKRGIAVGIDLPTADLLNHFGTKTVAEFFDRYPLHAATYFFYGYHPITRRSSKIALEILKNRKMFPPKVIELALECLFRNGEASSYLWSRYSEAKKRGGEEEVLAWIQQGLVRWNALLPDALMFPLLEETGMEEDRKWREYVASRTAVGEKDVISYLDLANLRKRDSSLSSARPTGRIDRYGIQKFKITVVPVERGQFWLEERGYALPDAAAIILPPAFAKVDTRLQLMIRLFLGGLEPSVRRHVLRTLSELGETKPELVLQRLVELTDLPGLGQYLANLPPGIVPDEYREALRKSEEEVPPSSETTIRELANRIYGKKVYEERFRDAVLTPIGAGKAAEVWEVSPPGQETIVLKIVTDGRRRKTAAALSSLKEWGERLEYLRDIFTGVSPERAIGRFEETLKREMDMREEARNISLFEEMARECGVIIPTVRFAHEDLIEMTRLPIVPIEELPPAQMAELEEKTGRLIARAMVQRRILYTDPHAGNLKWHRTENKPVMLDFGQMVPLSDKFLRSLHQWIMALVISDAGSLQKELIQLMQKGTTGKIEEIDFREEISRILATEDLPSAKIQQILGKASHRGAEVGSLFSDLLKTILFWEGAMRKNSAPHNDFVTTYLVPALIEKFGAGSPSSSGGSMGTDEETGIPPVRAQTTHGGIESGNLRPSRKDRLRLIVAAAIRSKREIALTTQQIQKRSTSGSLPGDLERVPVIHGAGLPTGGPNPLLRIVR